MSNFLLENILKAIIEIQHCFNFNNISGVVSFSLGRELRSPSCSSSICPSSLSCRGCLPRHRSKLQRKFSIWTQSGLIIWFMSSPLMISMVTGLLNIFLIFKAKPFLVARINEFLNFDFSSHFLFYVFKYFSLDKDKGPPRTQLSVCHAKFHHVWIH